MKNKFKKKKQRMCYDSGDVEYENQQKKNQITSVMWYKSESPMPT
jgi:hypothetical protein